MNIYLMTDTGWKYFENVSSEELNKRNIRIGEGARIGAWARIGEGASIKKQTHCIVMTNLGSRNATMTAYLHKDTIWIGTGCYLGEVGNFMARVKATHGENDHAKTYQASVEYAKKVLKP